MAIYGERFMRILVFFDLPTLTKKNRKEATKFRNSLIKDGYIMLQWSVYSRLCKGLDVIEKHQKRLQNMMPTEGSIRTLVVTEKQYATMGVLLGKLKKEEEIGDIPLLLL